MKQKCLACNGTGMKGEKYCNVCYGEKEVVSLSFRDVVLFPNGKSSEAPWGVVDRVDYFIGTISFHTHPFKGQSEQKQARLIDSVFMGSEWSEVWPNLANFGIRDPRCTLNNGHHWIDMYQFLIDAHCKDVSEGLLRNIVINLDILQAKAKADGSWREIHAWLDKHSVWEHFQKRFQETDDAIRMDDESTMEYWLAVQETY